MRKPISLFEAFKNAVMHAPDGSRKDAFDYFLEVVSSDPRYLEALADTYFEQNYKQWRAQKIGQSYSLVATPAAQRRSEVSADRRADTAVRVHTATQELKARVRAVVLLDLLLPNGKKLRHATGAECAKAGGFYTEVSRHLKPTEVVDKKLNERDLQNIQSRFVGGRRAVAALEHRVAS